MNMKTFTILALAIFSFVLAGQTAKADGHEQVAEAVEAQAEMETSVEAGAEAEDAGAVKAEAEVNAEAEAKEAESAKTDKADSEKNFDEKVAAYNEDKDEKEKVICRREKRTGSHFSRRRCVTASQAKREREEAQDALQRAQRGSNVGPID